jgi:integrase
MPRKRIAENHGLPPRWRRKHGAYYYRVPKGCEAMWGGKNEFRLGATLPEAHRVWAERLDIYVEAKTVGQLLDRYAAEVVPTKGAKAQREQPAQIARLRGTFGHMPMGDFDLTHAYGYQDKRKNKKGEPAHTAANRELEILSHAFTKAVRWGYVKESPFTTGRFEKLHTPARTRYVEDAEVAAALEAAGCMRQKRLGQMLRAYIRLKLATGRRRSEILRLRTTDILEEGVRFTLTKSARKTGVRTIVMPWTDELRHVVNELKAVRPVDIAPWLFVTRKGKPYITDDAKTRAFDSLWQRFMNHVLATTEVKVRFHEHDLRAKAGTDVESVERAQELLQHASAATTRIIYRRKPEVVKPTR